jgi:hypothetical protein
LLLLRVTAGLVMFCCDVGGFIGVFCGVMCISICVVLSMRSVCLCDVCDRLWLEFRVGCGVIFVLFSRLWVEFRVVCCGVGVAAACFVCTMFPPPKSEGKFVSKSSPSFREPLPQLIALPPIVSI